jgi:hypothetical protein
MLNTLLKGVSLSITTGDSTSSSPRSFSIPNTIMHNTSNVPLFRVLSKYSRIDRNIKRVENCLDTTDSFVNELDSFACESIVIR